MGKDKGILAAGLGVSCCILPLILVAAGLGGSILTIFLVRYKAYLMIGAVSVLALAWAQYVRDARECSSRMCELAGGKLRQWSLSMSSAIVAFFLLITYTPAGALVGIDYGLAGAAVASQDTGGGAVSGPAAGPKRQTRMEKLVLRVEGMS